MAEKTSKTSAARKVRNTSSGRKTGKAKRAASKARPGRAQVDFASWDLGTAAERISAGLSPRVLDDIQHSLHLTRQELADAVMISYRTLTRRRGEPRLAPDESERAYRLARLIEIASEILGGQNEASDWLKEPNFALGDRTPLEVARTEPGAKLVERVLRQIEHGIPV